MSSFSGDIKVVVSQAKLVALSHDQRVAALCRLEANSGQYQADLRLSAIDKLLALPEDFMQSDLIRILGKRKYPLKIQRALKLYVMMARLMKICEPKGQTLGPACRVRLIDFEHLTFDQALDLKNGIGFTLLFKLNNSAHQKNSFRGFDLLSPEEKNLYFNVKAYFEGRGKPTLKVLAARLLRDSEDRLFSDRTVIRYIEALKVYEFAEEDPRRDYLISSVDSFGTHNKSARESARHAMAQAVMQIGPVIREQMIPVMAQTAQVLAETLPRISAILPQLGQSIVLMRETLPALRLTLPQMVQSVAEIPVVFPQLKLAVADLCRSLPQTLSLVANLKLNLRQN